MKSGDNNKDVCHVELKIHQQPLSIIKLGVISGLISIIRYQLVVTA